MNMMHHLDKNKKQNNSTEIPKVIKDAPEKRTKRQKIAQTINRPVTRSRLLFLFPEKWFAHVPLSTSPRELYSDRAAVDYGHLGSYFTKDTFSEVWVVLTRPGVSYPGDPEFRSHVDQHIHEDYRRRLNEVCGRTIGFNFDGDPISKARHFAFVVGESLGLWSILGVCTLGRFDVHKWLSSSVLENVRPLMSKAPPAFLDMMPKSNQNDPKRIAEVRLLCAVPGLGAELLRTVEDFYDYRGYALASVGRQYGFYYSQGYRAFHMASGTVLERSPDDFDHDVKTGKRRLHGAMYALDMNYNELAYHMMKPKGAAFLN
jgi:hypothetical protein